MLLGGDLAACQNALQVMVALMLQGGALQYADVPDDWRFFARSVRRIPWGWRRGVHDMLWGGDLAARASTVRMQAQVLLLVRTKIALVSVQNADFFMNYSPADA